MPSGTASLPRHLFRIPSGSLSSQIQTSVPAVPVRESSSSIGSNRDQSSVSHSSSEAPFWLIRSERPATTSLLAPENRNILHPTKQSRPEMCISLSIPARRTRHSSSTTPAIRVVETHHRHGPKRTTGRKSHVPSSRRVATTTTTRRYR